ncbi:hypothetical protein Salat_2421700 [Sesamum alatum]|uniref:Uncharacterized protein n=1 Tax=Sesamum alatum TaxID=300844 RepID=A0AAE1XZ21_9LAMI|nr:hypothetical protein Salat_2421700 [Sesamum alatum]
MSAAAEGKDSGSGDYSKSKSRSEKKRLSEVGAPKICWDNGGTVVRCWRARKRPDVERAEKPKDGLNPGPVVNVDENEIKSDRIARQGAGSPTVQCVGRGFGGGRR